MKTDTYQNTLTRFHHEIRGYKSNSALVHDEMIFIEKLISSYIFVPHTPNLFEQLQRFKKELVEQKKKLASLEENLLRHDNKISGIIECDTIECDYSYEQEHEELKEFYERFMMNYNSFKKGVFEYCGGILKSHKK